MKIRKVDDKPMVIHTKEKAKIHAHEPKGAKIKGSNIYTVERGPKVHDAKANEMDKKASAKLMLQKSAGGKRTYRKSTIHQSEATEPVEPKAETEPLFEEMVDFDTFSKSDFRVVKVKECSAVKKSKKLLHFVLDDGTGTDRIILSGIHAYYEPEELVGKTLLAITNLPPRSMMGIDSCGMLLSAVHTVNGEEKLNLVMLDDAIPAGAKLY